jgi:hypothetical protein
MHTAKCTVRAGIAHGACGYGGAPLRAKDVEEREKEGHCGPHRQARKERGRESRTVHSTTVLYVCMYIYIYIYNTSTPASSNSKQQTATARKAVQCTVQRYYMLYVCMYNIIIQYL